MWLKCFSLFSGIGGFDLAFQNLGHEIVGGCEIDKYARQIYSRHFPGIKIWGDVKEIDPSALPKFDILTAGFPCPTFSIAGKRLGFKEPRGELFFEIARIVKQTRPRLLLLENVKGLLSHDSGRTFAVILSTLDELGYDVEWQMFNSKYFVPQNRERIFIIGHLRGECSQQIFPLGENDKGNDRARQKTQRERKWISGTIDSSYYKGAGSRTIIKINKGASQGYRVYDTEGIGQTLAANAGGIGAKMGLVAVPVLTPNRMKRRQNGRRFKKEGEPAFTITTIDQHGIFDGKTIRTLTPLECERLQGFPDNWTEGISNVQRYKCVGNAVTVPVIEYIVKNFQV